MLRLRSGDPFPRISTPFSSTTRTLDESMQALTTTEPFSLLRNILTPSTVGAPSWRQPESSHSWRCSSTDVKNAPVATSSSVGESGPMARTWLTRSRARWTRALNTFGSPVGARELVGLGEGPREADVVAACDGEGVSELAVAETSGSSVEELSRAGTIRSASATTARAATISVASFCRLRVGTSVTLDSLSCDDASWGRTKTFHPGHAQGRQ